MRVVVILDDRKPPIAQNYDKVDIGTDVVQLVAESVKLYNEEKKTRFEISEFSVEDS